MSEINYKTAIINMAVYCNLTKKEIRCREFLIETRNCFQ